MLLDCEFEPHINKETHLFMYQSSHANTVSILNGLDLEYSIIDAR